MAYYFELPGIGPVKCDTIEELKLAAAEYAGKIGEVKADRPRKPGAGRPPKPRPMNKKSGKSPGVGPERSWAMAEWHSVKTGAIKNDARAQLGKLRKENARKFHELADEFEKFVQFYAGKAKSASVEEARTALRALYEADIEKYTAAVAEYDKRSKK